MSSDLLCEECLDCDNNLVNLSISMNHHGYLFISIFKEYAAGGIETFNIGPTKEGIMQVENIQSAFKSWVKHTKQVVTTI